MNQESTSSPAGFAFARLSSDELVRLGLAEVHLPTWPPSNPEAAEPEFPPTSAETPGRYRGWWDWTGELVAEMPPVFTRKDVAPTPSE